MSSNLPTLLLILLPILIPFSNSQSSTRAIYINCGSTTETLINGTTWLPDAHFNMSAGTAKTLPSPVTSPLLSTLRSFPLLRNRKFCYVIPVYRHGRYLVRTTYYYYNELDANTNPPIFYQVVDGTVWGSVNTKDDYAKKNASYYEGVFNANGNTMSVCVAANLLTESNPFISALELVMLEPSVYNATDFGASGLRLVARNSFGNDASTIRYYNTMSFPFLPVVAGNLTSVSTRNISTSGFWNLPPAKIFESSMAQSQPIPLEFPWPSVSLLKSTYYIAMYFAEGGDTSSFSTGSRVFSVKINDVVYYDNLTLTTDGSVIFSTKWPLAGLTNISLTPAAESDMGPLINGAEVFEVLPLGRKTHTGDVIALEKVKDSLLGYPVDWNGDPCMPKKYAWTGVTCDEGSRTRVVSVNLTGMGVSGLLSPNITNLTALTNLSLGNNNLTGSIPDLSSLRRLQKLHLDSNQFSGEIPQSLFGMLTLTEVFLQNNNLSGQVPIGWERPGLDLRLHPGNNLLGSPPPT